MSALLTLFFLASIIFFVIGLFSPSTSLFWYKKARTRGRSALIYGGATLIFFVAFGVTHEETVKEPVQRAVRDTRRTHDAQEQQDGADDKEEVAYSRPGDVVVAGSFNYKIRDFQFRKTVGNDEFTRKTADGIFLIVALSIKNTDAKPHTLDNSFFKLTDEEGVKYESSREGEMALELSGNETLFLKQFNPNIEKAGLLIFEVPEKKPYKLHLSGGFWSGRTNVVRLVP